MEETKTDEPDIIKSVGQLQNPQTSDTSADSNTIQGIDDNNLTTAAI